MIFRTAIPISQVAFPLPSVRARMISLLVSEAVVVVREEDPVVRVVELWEV